MATWVGARVSLRPPLPSWPEPPSPQAQTVPSDRTAYPLDGPAAIALTSLMPATRRGTVLDVAPPLPCTVGRFAPQAQTVPSAWRAYPLYLPPLTAMTSVSPL